MSENGDKPLFDVSSLADGMVEIEIFTKNDGRLARVFIFPETAINIAQELTQAAVRARANGEAK
ncbi:hypothetical protein NBRC3280_3304 [Acetobacter pasteurianus NBRC 3280]|uniref:Uncharacterized protein n=1 Tax=Acetobacter pasteurianus NBRC 3278 TaxID=1226660 RepID=A0A401X9B4_ACEPA|nr:hypothetical protein [Acetobacter pasteurianus]GCD60723.1 hypothetical protein NBRC3277_3298 [Acetobacter pasteurianus NBRC 3277]GCD64318.1 hypothetical protein NBRC3278_3411 [Acetobacter pasteurianus NBRC 3278]GCD70669.1 hypothetical protein NBRC3280_3304 [Acetobacter pasteurianus NBRC 3280]